MPSSLSSIPPKRTLHPSTTTLSSNKASIVRKRPRIVDSEEEKEAETSEEEYLSKTVKKAAAEKGKGKEKEKEKVQKPDKEKVIVKKRKSTGTTDPSSTATNSTTSTALEASTSGKKSHASIAHAAQSILMEYGQGDRSSARKTKNEQAASDVDELASGGEDVGGEETEEAKAARLKREKKEKKARKRAKREARESRAEEARLQAEAAEQKIIEDEELGMTIDRSSGNGGEKGEAAEGTNGEVAQEEPENGMTVKGFADDSDYEEDQEQQDHKSSTTATRPAQTTSRSPAPDIDARQLSPSAQTVPAMSSAALRQGIPILPSDPTQKRRSVPPPPPPPPPAAAPVPSASSSPNPFAMPLSSSPPPIHGVSQSPYPRQPRSRTSSHVESNGAKPVSPVASPTITGRPIHPQANRQDSARFPIETNQPQIRNDFPPSPAQSAPSPDFTARATPTPVTTSSAAFTAAQGEMDVDPPSRNNSPLPESSLPSRFTSAPLRASPIPLGHGRRSASPLAQARTSQPPTPVASTSTFRLPPRDKQPHQLSRSVSAAPQEPVVNARELPFISDDWSRHPKDGLNVFDQKEKVEIEKMCRVHRGVVLEQRFAFENESELMGEVAFDVGFAQFRDQLSLTMSSTSPSDREALPVRARLVFRTLDKEARTSNWPILFQVHLNKRTVRTYNRLAGKPILSYQALDITSLLDLTGSNSLTLARWPQDSLPPSLSISIELYSVFTRESALEWIQQAQKQASRSQVPPDGEYECIGHKAHLHNLSVDKVVSDNFFEGSWKCPECDEHLLVAPMTKDGVMVFPNF
ncbi:hypothetical protein JCM5353_006771 [Sporobolomyces roseus]